MTQLCLWTKIRIKQWLVLGAPAFQCMRAGFLCPKCENFACLHTRQYQNELHVKRSAKSASSISRTQAHLAKRKRIWMVNWLQLFTLWLIELRSYGADSAFLLQHIVQYYHDFHSNVEIFPSVVQVYKQPYSFGGKIKLIICQIRHELSITINEISTSWKKR